MSWRKECHRWNSIQFMFAFETGSFIPCFILGWHCFASRTWKQYVKVAGGSVGERNHGRAEQSGNVFYFEEPLAWVRVQAELGCAALPSGQLQPLIWDEVVEVRFVCLYPHSQQCKQAMCSLDLSKKPLSSKRKWLLLLSQILWY